MAQARLRRGLTMMAGVQPPGFSRSLRPIWSAMRRAQTQTSAVPALTFSKVAQSTS